jgi:hypothetical protein
MEVEESGGGGNGIEGDEPIENQEEVIDESNVDEVYPLPADSSGDQTVNEDTQEELHEELEYALQNPDMYEAASQAWVEIFAKGYDPTRDARFTSFSEFDQGNISFTFALYQLQLMQDAGVKPGLNEVMGLFVAGGVVASFDSRQSSTGFVNLASPARTRHILYGDATGGGHIYGAGKGKSEFPANWSGDKIMHAISDVASSPNSVYATQRGGRIIAEGYYDGVKIRAVIEGNGSDIVTGFPIP